MAPEGKTLKSETYHLHVETGHQYRLQLKYLFARIQLYSANGC